MWETIQVSIISVAIGFQTAVSINCLFMFKRVRKLEKTMKELAAVSHQQTEAILNLTNRSK